MAIKPTKAGSQVLIRTRMGWTPDHLRYVGQKADPAGIKAEKPFVSVAIRRFSRGPVLAASGLEAGAMFHSDTQILIDTWTALGEAAVIPDRANLDPTALGLLLPRAFMAVRRGDGAEFRLAGSWIETFHGDSLGGTAWLPWWSESSRPLVADAITRTFREARPVIIVAGTEDDVTALEITLTPLRGADGTADRILGLYAPTTAQARDLVNIDSLTARVSVGVGDIRRAPLSLATLDGRLIA